jgi:hypothetical protein
MQSLLTLLRTRFARFSLARRTRPAKMTDSCAPGPSSAPGTSRSPTVTVLSYDSFR